MPKLLVVFLDGPKKDEFFWMDIDIELTVKPSFIDLKHNCAAYEMRELSSLGVATFRIAKPLSPSGKK